MTVLTIVSRNDCRFRRRWQAAVTAGMVLFLSGCLSPPPPRGYVHVFPTVPSDVRTTVGHLAVIPTEHSPQFHRTVYRIPEPLKGAGEGAEYGAGYVARLAMQSGPLVGSPLGMLAMAGATLIGAGVGAVQAHSTERVAETESALREAVPLAHAHSELADLVVTQIRTTSTDIQVERPAGTPTREALQHEGFDTVLDVGLPRVWLNGEGKFDPDVTISIEAAARLVRLADGQELWRRTWIWRSEPRSFFDSGENGAQRCREDFARGLKELAFQIRYELFAATKPEIHTDPWEVADIPPGQVWAVLRTASPLAPTLQ